MLEMVTAVRSIPFNLISSKYETVALIVVVGIEVYYHLSEVYMCPCRLKVALIPHYLYITVELRRNSKISCHWLQIVGFAIQYSR